jgi:hypothetical protein
MTTITKTTDKTAPWWQTIVMALVGSALTAVGQHLAGSTGAAIGGAVGTAIGHAMTSPKDKAKGV